MKKTLQTSIILLTLIGLYTLLSVFSDSMLPSEQARSERSQHDIKNIELGSYLFVSSKRKTAWNNKVLIIKDWSGNIYVHLLPTNNKTVSLPDRYWGWAVYGCKDFGPETDKNNNIIKNGIIKCHDKDTPEWFDPKQWLWTYSGKAIHEWLPNMLSPKYEIKEGTLFING